VEVPVRRRSLASATVLALSAALVLPLGGVASASACVTAGDVPHLVANENGIHAAGVFGCADPAEGMSITVCIEERFLSIAGAEEWWSRGCETTTEPDGAVSTITGSVTVPMMVYSTYLRTTVTAVNNAGDAGTFTSPPMFWFNCACYVG
jgi:hypothetical protein